MRVVLNRLCLHMRQVSFRWMLLLAAVQPLLLAQSQNLSAHEKEGGGHVVLVLPFDNRSGNPNLNWIGDSFPDTLNQRFISAGFLPITRDDRLFALDHLGLPADFRPSRATTLRVAQTLDADYVIVGSYNLEGQRIAVQAQVLEVNRLHLSPPLLDSAETARLFDVENAIAWKVARQILPHFAVAEQTFVSASGGIRLTAFENYIRGTDASSPTERIKRLETAVADSPNYAAAELALGKELYANREYEKAAATLGKVPLGEREALEANFYLGLARFNDGKYAEAERAFAFVASELPLPEVLNDEGVALTRQKKDGATLFQQALAADPNDADFHYNLAIVEYQHGDFAGALRDVQRGLELRPGDAEAAELKTRISAGRAAASDAAKEFEPTTRLRRTFSEASFRQATFQMDQMRALRLASLPPAQAAVEYSQIGEDYLKKGLLPEAEQQFSSALTADPNCAPAHAGLAAVREQSGSLDEARLEAATAVRIGPTADRYVMLARIDLRRNETSSSATEVRKALELEPGNESAAAVRRSLEQRGVVVP